MNLSDLITAAPEATKTNGPVADVVDGDGSSAEAGEFLSLTQDLTIQAAEVPKKLAPQTDIKDASALKTENTNLLVNPQEQDTELPNDPPGATALTGDVEQGVPVLFAASAASSGTQLVKPTNSRLSDAERAPNLPLETGEQFESAIDKPFGTNGANKDSAATPVPIGPVPAVRIGDVQPPMAENTAPTQSINVSKSSPQSASMSVANGPVPTLTVLRPDTRNIEVLSFDRSSASGLTPNRENSTAPQITEVVRSIPELSPTFSASVSSATEPRVFQFLSAQGALQPLGSEALLSSGQSTAGLSPTIPPANNVIAGALSSEASVQTAQRNILPQIVGSMQTLQHGGVIDLMLDPPELGRIEILIELSDKVLRATLTADRSGTGDLIRRHADDLMQQLADAGFADVDLNFADQREDSSESDVSWVVSDHPPEETTSAIGQSPQATMLNAHGRVDLRL